MKNLKSILAKNKICNTHSICMESKYLTVYDRVEVCLILNFKIIIFSRFGIV